MSLLDQYLREADSYAAIRPGRMVSESNLHFPGLHALFRHAKLVTESRQKAKYFTRQGVQYSIIRHRGRLCVMHASSCRVLVGEVGASDESKKPHP